MPEPLIAHVSDTARWVAAYRAQESARPDALFKDSLAARLAGEHGLRIAERARSANGDNGWPVFMVFPDPDPRRLGKGRWGAIVRFERGSLR